MKTLFTSLNEALLSANNLSKDNSFLLKDLLDPIPKIEYEITKNGNKNLITFTSDVVGFEDKHEKDKNPLIDGNSYHCDILFSRQTGLKKCSCYLNLSNMIVDSRVTQMLCFCGNLDNLYINTASDLKFSKIEVIKNVTAHSRKFISIEGVGDNRDFRIQDLSIDSPVIELNSWKGVTYGQVVFSCASLSVNETYLPWELLVYKMQTTFQSKTRYGIIKEDLLKKMIEACLYIKFKQFPIKITFTNGNKEYAFDKQAIGKYVMRRKN